MGRTGRIINILYLVDKGLLDMPVLFLSHYILRNKSAYYQGLRQVTEQGAWENWILYMLEAIEATALETQQRAIKILDAMAEAKEVIQAKAPKIYSKDLIELVFKNPYCKVKFLEEAHLAKRQTAATYLKTLEDLKLLRGIKVGREQYYINERLIKLFRK